MKKLNAIEIAAAACGLVSDVSCSEISQEALEKAMVQVEVWNILRAAKEIWYDNGMVNRIEPEDEKVKLLVQWLSVLDQALVRDMEKELSKLNDDDLHALCCGFEEDQERLGSVELNDFLGRIFNEEYEVKAESKEAE